jgi:hypothetical protein
MNVESILYHVVEHPHLTRQCGVEHYTLLQLVLEGEVGAMLSQQLEHLQGGCLLGDQSGQVRRTLPMHRRWVYPIGQI